MYDIKIDSISRPFLDNTKLYSYSFLEKGRRLSYNFVINADNESKFLDEFIDELIIVRLLKDV